MQELSRFAVKSLVAIAALTVFSVEAASSTVVVMTRGLPSPYFATSIATALQSSLSIAMVEMAYGDVTRAARHARASGLPQKITVAIDTSSISGSRANDLRKWSEEAVSEWQDAVPTVEIAFVPSSANATAQIRFEDRLVVDGRRVAGFIEWQRRVSTRGTRSELDLRAQIKISNRFASGGLMTESQIKKAVAHEFGHLLGLQDDDCSRSIMGPVGPTALGSVGEKEKQAVAELHARSEQLTAAANQVRPESRQPRIFVFAK
jgi:hypothetical protein